MSTYINQLTSEISLQQITKLAHSKCNVSVHCNIMGN